MKPRWKFALHWVFWGMLLACGLSPGIATADETPATPAAIRFNRDVRAILSEHCFACHGPDAKKREAGLRLDLEAGAVATLESGKQAIVPGKVESSELVRRILTDDPDERMPPPSMPTKLSAREIEILRRWVAEGAAWESHWAYGPLQRPTPPALAAGDQAGRQFVRNPIDQFILAGLAIRNFSASPTADAATLARRLSFDLLGLPPSPEEALAFVAAADPAAYEREVDRLLASPHYGERMAIYWLDLVRYADTGGYHSDNHRDVHLYRDYVVDAFNANKPFDQFTIEQIAGDLLPDATREQRIASGYNRLLQTTEEGGAQPKEYEAKYAADRVRNATTVWLAATLGCAQCHDHKYDPYTQREFYSFAAFFADVKERDVGRQEQTSLPTPADAERLESLDEQVGAQQRVLATSTPELAAAQAIWETANRSTDAHWTVLRPAKLVSRGGADLKPLDDGSIFVSGPNADKDSYTLEFTGELAGVTGLRLEALPDDRLPAKGPGRAHNGNFVLSDFRVAIAGPESAADGAAAESTKIPLARASADHSQANYDVAGAIDDQAGAGWAILPQVGKPHVAVFETRDDLAVSADRRLTITLSDRYGGAHSIGRFRLSVTKQPRPVVYGDALPAPIAAILATDPAGRSPEQRDQLAAHYRSIAPQLAAERAKLAELEKARAEFAKTLPTSLIAMAGPPRTLRVLPRGNWLDESGVVVQPAVPASLPPLAINDRRPTRLDLARWLVARENPAAARVLVNRLWRLLFGEGLVKTADDFGAQGSWPTHPELLDWLAAELVESGWDVKHVVKLIVTSGAYRQTSHAGAALLAADPYNKWIARQGRFRLDAEMVRDNALAASGLLVRKLGGPLAKPYQPAGYWANLNFPTREWSADHGEQQYRRGLYTYWCRTFLHPSLAAFDASSREECVAMRTRSSTPMQALVLLNDPTYVESARVLAELTCAESGPEPAARIRWMCTRVLSRAPSPEEAGLLEELFQKHLGEYRADEAAARQITSVGDAKPPQGDLPELAAWTSVARVLLNLHETITRN